MRYTYKYAYEHVVPTLKIIGRGVVDFGTRFFIRTGNGFTSRAISKASRSSSSERSEKKLQKVRRVSTIDVRTVEAKLADKM